MFRFLIRLLLAIFTFRVLIGLARFAARIASRDSAARVGSRRGDGPGEPRERAPRPLVDRTSAIDVPFTEESRES